MSSSERRLRQQTEEILALKVGDTQEARARRKRKVREVISLCYVLFTMERGPGLWMSLHIVDQC